MIMRATFIAFALLALASPARSQPAAIVTVVQADGTELGDTHELHCTAEACRGNLPIIVLGRVCHLNVHVAFPDPAAARVILATDACQPELRIGGLETSAVVTVKANGVASKLIGLPYAREMPVLVREPMLRPAVAFVRLDLLRRPG